MKHHFRVFASLIVLLAFAATFAEGVWASACATETVSHTPVAAVSDPVAGADHCDDPAPMPTDGGSCPFAALAATGCAPVFVVPSAERAPLARSSALLRPPAASDRLPHLLVSSSLFRPPRA